MSNESNEISDIVKKCKILLLDIEGTTTSISFVKDKLFPYAEENVKEFLDTQWDNEDVKEVVVALRKLALEDQEKSVEGVVAIPGEDASKEDQIKGLVESVKWQMSQDRKVGALKQLQGLIWKQGYDKGDIKGHVYDDVLPALQLWRSVDDQKVYIYSSGSVQAQKLLFGQSLSGDMLPVIDGHFDTAVGAKQEAASYTAIAEKIGCKPEEILFLTDIVKEGEAARASGMQVALVSREGNAPLPSEATSTFPVLHSFAQLINTNKRKPPSQDDQPAKVLKTDTEANVKTASEDVSSVEAPEKIEEPEKMDVEEPVNDKVDQNKAIQATHNETIVEEVTDANVVADAPICEIEPIVEETIENTNKKETPVETMEVIDNATLSEEKSNLENKKGEDKARVTEETPPMVITEIEELSDEKQTLSEVAEIIEDLEPVVEEPPVIEEIDDIQNVGEVLEKECDEILSKVQDVTNLDNIPLKPLLNTIVEETMETENIDSNDIVDRILDTEMELEMKACEDIEVNKAQEMSNVKIQTEVESSNKEKNDTDDKISDNKPIEHFTEQSKDIDYKNEESSAKKANIEDIKKDVKETNVESVENKIETEENKQQTVENKKSEESPKETVINIENKDHNKVEEPNKIDVEESKMEGIENKTEEMGNTTDVVENKVEVVEKKVEVVEKKVEVVEKKVEIVENKTEVVENETDVAENKTEIVENKTEVVVSKTEVAESKEEIKERKMEVEKEVVLDTKVETDKPATESQETPKESPVTEVSTETKEIVSVPEEVKIESEVTTEAQVNGKTTNGATEAANLNGDVCQDEELSSRLSVENGKEEVNGSNGDSNDAEQEQGDNKMETEIADIKVKSVSTDEPRSDPIEQPTEA